MQFIQSANVLNSCIDGQKRDLQSSQNSLFPELYILSMAIIIISINYQNHHQIYKSVYHTIYLDIFMLHLHTIFKMSGSNDSFVIAMKTKAKYRFHVAVFVISHSTEKNVSVRVPLRCIFQRPTLIKCYAYFISLCLHRINFIYYRKLKIMTKYTMPITSKRNLEMLQINLHICLSLSK